MKKLILIVGTLLMGALPAGVPIVAHADNAAVAINTTDGKTVWRISFKITRTASDVVNQTNIAFAYSSCTDCSTYAIAFQTVLMTNDPSIVTPTNMAIALNYLCTDCTTYADATQVNLTTDGAVHFTPEGNQELAAIRHDLHALRHEDLALDDLAAQVHVLAERLNWVVATQLVPAGNG